MASLNKCSFIGNVGKMETRYMTNDDAVTSFSLAVNESWKDKNGEKHEKTEWVNCVAFRKLAEVMAEYVKKGQQLYIEGKFVTEKYQDKQTGADRYATKIIVNEMQMLGGKREADPSDMSGAQQAMSGAAKPAAKTAPATNGSFDNFDDDIPF